MMPELRNLQFVRRLAELEVTVDGQFKLGGHKNEKDEAENTLRLLRSCGSRAVLYL